MKVTKFLPYTMLEVRWDDIVSSSGWHEASDIKKAGVMPVRTVGYFFENQGKNLKVVHSVTADGESDYTIIPYGVIRKIEVLYGSDKHS